MLDGAEQIDQGAAHPIDGPSHDHVELPAAGVVEHGIKRRALVAVLGARDALVGIDLDHFPVTDSLCLSVETDVDGCAPAHDPPLIPCIMSIQI